MTYYDLARRLTYLILTVAGIAVLFLAWSAWRNSHSLSDEQMLKRLPTADSIVLSIDFGQLRHSAVFAELAGSKVVEEPDYVAFVKDTGFDYKRDLDRAFVAFAPAGTFFVVRGRFDWKRLQAYAKQSGGSCYNDLCHMPGSLPERRISLVPLATDVLGLVVSTDDMAASQLLKAGAQRSISEPTQPVWVSVPGRALQRVVGSIPVGGLLSSGLTGVSEVMMTVGPQGSGLKVHMEAQCSTPQNAETLTGQLRTLTSILKAAIERNKNKPNPRDLTGVLTRGEFRQQDRMVSGDWMLQKSFVDQLTGM